MARQPRRWALPALVLASCVPGTTYLGFTTGVASAPPPPREVVVAEPAVALVADGVYVVTDPGVRYDMFRFGATWYVYSDGYWYRGASYRGPFAVVDVRHVPRPVLTVPRDGWKHRRYARPPGHERDRERRRGHDRDGDDRGHDDRD